VPLFTSGGLGLDLKNLVLFTSLCQILRAYSGDVHGEYRITKAYLGRRVSDVTC